MITFIIEVIVGFNDVLDYPALETVPKFFCDEYELRTCRMISGLADRKGLYQLKQLKSYMKLKLHFRIHFTYFVLTL